MPSSEHEVFADKTVELLKEDPDLTKLKKDYQKEVLSRARAYLIKHRISTPAQLRDFDVYSEIYSVSEIIRSKKVTLQTLELGKTEPARAWRIRNELYNNLEPHHDALSLLHNWAHRR